MESNTERRSEKRLRYHWPVWFAEDFENILIQGQMVDVSSGGAAFTCYKDHQCPFPDQEITARFSVPCFEGEESFSLSSFTRNGRVCRVEDVNNFLKKVAIQFAEPLPFKPGEQAKDEADQLEKLQSLAI